MPYIKGNINVVEQKNPRNWVIFYTLKTCIIWGLSFCVYILKIHITFCNVKNIWNFCHRKRYYHIYCVTIINAWGHIEGFVIWHRCRPSFCPVANCYWYTNGHNGEGQSSHVLVFCVNFERHISRHITTSIKCYLNYIFIFMCRSLIFKCQSNWHACISTCFKM